MKTQTRTRSLAHLAREIVKEHTAAETGIRTSLTHARHAGALLLEVKGRLAHGEFMPWVATHCPFSHDTANLYMKLSTLPNSESVRTLTLRQAATLLGAPDVPEDDDKFPETRDRLFSLGILTAADLEGLSPQQTTMFVAEVHQADEELGTERWEERIAEAQASPDPSRAPQVQAAMDRVPVIVNRRGLASFARETATLLREGKLGGKDAIRKRVRCDERLKGKIAPPKQGSSHVVHHRLSRGIDTGQETLDHYIPRYVTALEQICVDLAEFVLKIHEVSAENRDRLAQVCPRLRATIDALMNALAQAEATATAHSPDPGGVLTSST